MDGHDFGCDERSLIDIIVDNDYGTALPITQLTFPCESHILQSVETNEAPLLLCRVHFPPLNNKNSSMNRK